MTTSTPHTNAPTYESINMEIERLYNNPETQELLFNKSTFTNAISVAHLTSLYGAVRPILMVIASLPLLAQQWREVLNAFILAIDALLATMAPVPPVTLAVTQ